MTPDQDVALALARIEGKLDATLPELTAKSARLTDELTAMRTLVVRNGHTLAGHAERLDYLEARVSGQLGRTAQFVGMVGGVLGVLALIVPALAHSV